MENKALLNVKMDKKLKKEAQKVAKELGLPLSTVINQYLREFVRERQVTFSAPLVPNARTRKVLDQAVKDSKARKNIDGPFRSWKEVKAHLDSLKK